MSKATYNVLEVTLMEGHAPSRKTLMAGLSAAKAMRVKDTLEAKVEKQDYNPGSPVVCYLAQQAN